MKYMGSKSRIAKYILPILQNYILENNIINYYEPFCGGCNIIDKIICKNKFANDNNYYLIELYNNLEKLYLLPENVTKEHYSEVRNSYNLKNNQFEDWYIGAIGFLASYNGRFFDGGYAGIVKTKNGNIRNYYDEALRNLKSQSELLKNIKFKNLDYKNTNKNIKNFLIYCDPPYFNTKQYGTSKNFNHNEFWDWAREISKNNIVIISEENAPKDFQVIWEQNINRTIDNNKRILSVEKLFKYKE